MKRAVLARPTFLLAATLALLTSGCLRVTWLRDTRFAPPPADAVPTVERTGELSAALAALGAPLWVWEHEGDGVALAYGWRQSRSWGLNLSVPLSNDASASFDYTDVDREMTGVVLFFDRDLQLQEVRRGRLRDLTLERSRRRPAPAEEAP